MATEYKLSFTAREIDEKLTNIDIFENRIAALETGGAGGSGVSSSPANIYTFLDAYVAWCNGETFPIAFYGDSTFYGTNTSGDGYTFCDKLQTLLREECGSNATIYRVAQAGSTLGNAVSQFNSFFSSTGTYADTKMLGIGFGINDRLEYSTFKAYKEGVYARLENIINKCFENNIQPFLITSQATNECGVQTNYVGQYPLRDSNTMNICANGAKKELAKKYNIPLIDLNKYTELYLTYSAQRANTIISDRLHFGNIGHEYEAGFFFSNFVSRTIPIEKSDRCVISYSNQNLKSCIPEDKISYGAGDFKIFANYTKSDTTDTKILDAYIFVKDRQATLKAFKNEGGLTYIKINGVTKLMGTNEVDLGNLDLGLHHLEVYTGSSTLVNFNGFVINDAVVNDTANEGTERLLVDTQLIGTNPVAFTNTIVPCLLAFGFDSTNKTTALSGHTITKIEFNFTSTGDITIGKVDLNEYGKDKMTVLSPVVYSVKATEYQTIILDEGLVLNENEGLCIGAITDTAKFKYTDSYNDVTGKLITVNSFKSGGNNTIGLPCTVYGYPNES